jgi:3-dehydroquinate synthase
VDMKKKLEKMETYLEGSPAYYLAYDGEEKLIQLLKDLNADKVFLVEDTKVEELTKDSLYLAVKEELTCEKILFEASEKNKTFACLSDLCEEMIRAGVTKDSIIVAHGGGLVGNIAGLCAALIFRGIRFVEVPTTFLAQTDSVLSNKQAVNSSVGKNHFGVYYAPQFIFADVKYLTIDKPDRIKNGVVETIKNALISNKSLVEVLKKMLCSDGKYTEEELYQIVKISVLSKGHILEKDSSEKKYGVILEYGHTFGHAIEKLSSGEILHGEAVSIGMIVAGKISLKMKVMSQADYEEMVHFIRDYGGMNVKIPEDMTTEQIINAIQTDNKKNARGICYVLLSGIGKIYNPNENYMVTLEDSIVKEALDEYKTEVK